MTDDEWPLTLSLASIERRLECLDIVALMSDMLLAQSRGDVTLPAESHLRWLAQNGGQSRSLAMHALIKGHPQIAGVKIINANPVNTEGGLERASGLTLLFDIETARVRAILPAGPISAARTAAISTLAINHCRSATSAHLAFIGCGPIVKWHARLLTSGTFNWTSIAAFDLRSDRARAFAAYCADPGSVEHVASSPYEAVKGADVLIAATTATTPYIEMEWLKPGAIVVNVSLDDLTSEVLLGCDRLFVDDWNLSIEDEHRLLGRIARAGLVCGPGESRDGARPANGTIAHVVAATVPGRLSDSDIIVVNPFGMAAADILLADALTADWAITESATP